MEQKLQIRQYCQQFNLTGTAKVLDEMITDAESRALGYLDYTLSFLRTEACIIRSIPGQNPEKTAP